FARLRLAHDHSMMPKRRVARPMQGSGSSGRGFSRGPRQSKEIHLMHLVAYWQQFCAPYLRARLGRDERGASLVEYALLVALIAVICLVAIAFFGKSASSKFSSVGSSVGSA